MSGIVITNNSRLALSEKDSQSILDLFKNFIGSLSDEATLYVTDESCNKQYIIISDWMQSYCIQWIGNDYKFVGQDMVHCEHTTMNNGVKVTKEKMSLCIVSMCMSCLHMLERFLVFVRFCINQVVMKTEITRSSILFCYIV